MVAIIILNYNNPKDTINCISSVEEFNTFPCKYVIIDNGSTDTSVPILRKWLRTKFNNQFREFKENETTDTAPYISFVVAKENKGYACGNNIGLEFIEKDKDIDKILILNNDILFIQDIIPKLVEFLSENKDAAIVSPILMKKDGLAYDYNCARKNCTLTELFAIYILQRKPYWGILDKYVRKRKLLIQNPELIHKKCFEIELPSGSCMLISKNMFKAIDYFDSRTFLYYEENILFKKIEKIGKKNFILPHERCIHLGAATTSKTKYSYFQMIQVNSSAYIYAMNYSGMNYLQKILFYIFYKLFLLRKTIAYQIKKK